MIYALYIHIIGAPLSFLERILYSAWLPTASKIQVLTILRFSIAESIEASVWGSKGFFVAVVLVKDFKEGYLMVWANYIHVCLLSTLRIVGLCFQGTCDIISVTMAMHKVHKNVL